MQAIVTPRLRWTGLAILTLILPLTPLAAQAERYTIPGGDVAIYNLAGEVKVEPGSGEVTTEVTRGGADAAKLKVLKGEIDGWETLRVTYPADRIQYSQLSDGSSTQLRVRENGTFGDDRDGDDHGREGKQRGKRITIAGRGGGLDAHANLRVTVPPGKRVAIYLAVGKVSVTNVEGDLWIDAASAPVTTSNTRGELNIDVGSGAVQVSEVRGELSVDTGSGVVGVSNIRGEKVSVETGSGDVTASDLRSNELSVETGSGDIEVTGLVAPQVSLETGSGSVAADVQGEVWNVNVQTGSGDVTLKLPQNLGAEVDIETSSGDIETDYAVSVTRHARDHLTGRIGDGRGKIAIETGSGGIKLFKGQ
jgi:lia operon protein LiaG